MPRVCECRHDHEALIGRCDESMGIYNGSVVDSVARAVPITVNDNMQSKGRAVALQRGRMLPPLREGIAVPTPRPPPGDLVRYTPHNTSNTCIYPNGGVQSRNVRAHNIFPPVPILRTYRPDWRRFG